ncbi:MAG TPA: arsenic resistance N-acetyltransferase ArsN2 [Polyangiaceae bacterium]|nr:arsenic resistance N-acetyltransferase ArsN2 [Polyangiaceae bacterium]
MSLETNNTEGQTLEPANAHDLEAVLRLLSMNSLPVADVESHINAFTLARWNGILVGTAGLEKFGDVALLRSLCVAEHHRSKRIGLALVSAVVSSASAQGARELYLLTTEAAPYFEKLGFVTIERDQAPLEIRNTAQFSALCPNSAVCMRKPLARSLEAPATPTNTRGAG